MAYRKRIDQGIVQEVQPWVIVLLGCAADCGLSQEIIIFDFRGAGLFYRNKKYRGTVHEVQPTIFCLGWDKDAL